jgi:hypothetical protein
MTKKSLALIVHIPYAYLKTHAAEGASLFRPTAIKVLRSWGMPAHHASAGNIVFAIALAFYAAVHLRMLPVTETSP